jgi:hypothetical protein
MELLDKIDKLTLESTFGKQKSKDWFKFRGLIVGTKSKEELGKLLHQMQKSFKKSKDGLTEFELADMINQSLLKMNNL